MAEISADVNGEAMLLETTYHLDLLRQDELPKLYRPAPHTMPPNDSMKNKELLIIDVEQKEDQQHIIDEGDTRLTSCLMHT